MIFYFAKEKKGCYKANEIYGTIYDSPNVVCDQTI